MAWPTAATAKEALDDLNARIRSIKVTAQFLKDKSAAGTLRRDEAANFSNFLADARDALTAALAVSGLDAYAKGQYGPAFDVAAEGAARITAINNMQSWICGPTTANPGAGAANYPLGASGFLQEKTFDANGRWTVGTFTAGATAGFRTQVDAFLAGLS